MVNKNNRLWIVGVGVVAGVVLLLSAKKMPTDKVTMDNVVAQAPVVSQAASTEKDPVPSPAIVTSPEHGKEAGFSVQVYSFKDQKRANLALETLKKQGYENSYIEISDLGPKGTWYRVRIGNLKDETAAKELLSKIKEDFHSGIIVKVKQ